MANIIFNVAEKPLINFSPVSVTLLRDSIDIEYLDLNYSSGSGQQMLAGDILYASGTPNNLGFIQVKVVSDTTLSNSGSIPIELSSYPSNTQQNQTVQSTFDGSVMTFNLSYNSRPLVANNGFTIDNRSTKNFSVSDFESKYLDVAGTGVTGFNTEYFNPKELFYNENFFVSDLLFSTKAKECKKDIILLKHSTNWIKQNMNIDFQKSISYIEFKDESRQLKFKNKLLDIKDGKYNF